MLERQDFTIKGLEDFKSVFEFESDSETIAVISHPGWISHHIKMDAWFERYYKEVLKRVGVDELKRTGTARANMTAHNFLFLKEEYLNGRQILFENTLFERLNEKNIPTLVTVPVKPNGKSFTLSAVISPDFPNYLRDIRHGREEFYYVPTEFDPNSEKNQVVRGELYGDRGNKGLTTPLVLKFLETLKRKNVFVAGSNLDECMEALFVYLFFTESKVSILSNYCGLSLNSTWKAQPLEDCIYNQMYYHIRDHPQEEGIRNKVKKLAERSLEKARSRISKKYLDKSETEFDIAEGYVLD